MTFSVSDLENHAQRLKHFSILDHFTHERERFKHFSAHYCSFLLDYSKINLDQKALNSLIAFARSQNFEQKRQSLFEGGQINGSEKRAALHTALRAPDAHCCFLKERHYFDAIASMRERFLDFAERVRSGSLTGSTGKAFKNIVHIGIGGSDLGPRMVIDSLQEECDGPQIFFVSNVDPANLGQTLQKLDPETTLFFFASKTFTTQETMCNAHIAKAWLIERLGEAAITHHCVALTTHQAGAHNFGVQKDYIFGFWDFVGGRYSSWSAIGLPIACAIGRRKFLSFLHGAHRFDRHFLETPLEKNLPFLLGLIGYWHRTYCHYPSRALIPYAHSLKLFPNFLQQLDMESNGKSVHIDGHILEQPSAPVLWGSSGTDAQHSFFQLLHQGTDIIPVDFILIKEPHAHYKNDRRHQILLAHGLAQSRALMAGRSKQALLKEMLEQGYDKEEALRVLPHRDFKGNRPSMTLLIDRLTPDTLGGLMALYEHRVFTESVLYGINAFDQWGVELGKNVASSLLPFLEDSENQPDFDSSTNALINHIRHS